MSASSYSFVSMMQRFAPIMNEGGAAISLTYIASEKIIPGYGGGMSSAKAVSDAAGHGHCCGASLQQQPLLGLQASAAAAAGCRLQASCGTHLSPQPTDSLIICGMHRSHHLCLSACMHACMHLVASVPGSDEND